MRALREAVTEGLHVVVFDPKALAPAGEVDLDDLEGWAEEGALTLWRTPADGAFTVAVFVDEPPTEDLRLRAAGPLAERLLRVPGGRLHVVGAEALDGLAGAGAWPDDSALAVPPGDYAVTAFEVAWSAVDERALDVAVRGEAGAWPVRAVAAMGTAGGFLAMATVALAIPGLVLLLARPGWFLDALVRVGPALAVAWLVVLGLHRLPFVARVHAARERLDRARPNAVVALRRLGPEEPRPPGGAAIGGAYAEEWG